jgi:hypothetical protein
MARNLVLHRVAEEDLYRLGGVSSHVESDRPEVCFRVG